MYRKSLTILLPLYIAYDFIKGEKSIFFRQNVLFSESLIVKKNDKKVIHFLQSLDLKKVNFIKKTRIIVLHDSQNMRIYKYSSEESRREIKNNYLALGKIECFIQPKRISIIENEYSVLSAEEFLDSMPINIEQFDHDIYDNLIFKNLIKNLNECYYKNLKKIKLSYKKDLNQYDFLVGRIHFKDFNKIKHKLLLDLPKKSSSYVYKTQIHGDVTYRNVLSNNNNFSLIDFERSAFDFPEIDFLNFILDLNFHKKQHTSYKNYIDYLHTIYNNEEYLNIFKKLEKSKNFKLINFDNLRFVYLKFLIRQLAIVTNVSYYHKGVQIKSIFNSLNSKLNN
jgi:hypothetical protein